MPTTRALCIFTNLLGNKAMTSRLIAALDRLPGLEPTYIFLEVEDYKNFPAPWWARTTNPWHVEFIARQKARPVMDRPFDLLLVNGWEIAVAFRNLAHRMPAAAMMDAVPTTINAQLRRRGIKAWERHLSHAVHHRSFASAVRQFDFFLAWGSDCADSLFQNYGVRRDQCSVTLVPQDLEHWTPGPGNISLPIRLLFVANDFVRKGGDFLLRLYSQHLSGTCSLTIASNDPMLERQKFPTGVEWIRGKDRDQLLGVYRASDIFVLPTLKDCMPQVIGEALAAGLPCVANDVGAIGDLVHNGETGFLIPRDAPAEVWATHLNHLISNPAELRRMSKSARRFAEDNLGLDRFERLIAKVIERLRTPHKEQECVK